MSTHHRLSLFHAILININVMLGIGAFINTVELAKRAGALGCFVYIFLGILMLPLILSMAHLVHLHPEGGFYAYGRKEMNSFAGFLCAWGYFTGKLGSGAIVLHTAMRLIQFLMPPLQYIPTLILDLGMIILFIFLNTFNMQAGVKIQKGFIVCKIIPIGVAILLGLWLFQGSTMNPEYFDWSGIPLALPLVLFAIVGFEVACSISNKIKDPEKNAPRAILISYGIVITVIFLYQLLFYSALGNSLAGLSSYLEAFPTLLNSFLPTSPNFTMFCVMLLHLCLAASALGGSYGTMFSNSWNLYTLGKHNHLFFSSVVTKLNEHAIPVFCVIIEGLIYAFYLFISGGKQAPLQQLGALGCVFGYTVSILGLFIACLNKKYPNISIIIPALGLINCLILIAACVNGMIHEGAASLITFSVLLLGGSVMFFMTRKQHV